MRALFGVSSFFSPALSMAPCVAYGTQKERGLGVHFVNLKLSGFYEDVKEKRGPIIGLHPSSLFSEPALDTM